MSARCDGHQAVKGTWKIDQLAPGRITVSADCTCGNPECRWVYSTKRADVTVPVRTLDLTLSERKEILASDLCHHPTDQDHDRGHG